MENKEVGLTEYISNNQVVITTLGVFVAIAVGVSDFIQLPALSQAVSFLFIILSGLLFIELYRQFPHNRSKMLDVFWAFFCLAVFLLFLCVIVLNLNLVAYISVGIVIGFCVAGVVVASSYIFRRFMQCK